MAELHCWHLQYLLEFSSDQFSVGVLMNRGISMTQIQQLILVELSFKCAPAQVLMMSH